jgi:hypothetical protein
MLKTSAAHRMAWYRSKTTWMYYAHLDTLKVALLSASTYKSVKNTATGIDKYGASIRKIQRKLLCKFGQQTSYHYGALGLIF